MPEEGHQADALGCEGLGEPGEGLGERGNVGTVAAVANAVFHATGRRIRDLPVRIEDLLQENPLGGANMTVPDARAVWIRAPDEHPVGVRNRPQPAVEVS
jgi:hypothetical protein